MIKSNNLFLFIFLISNLNCKKENKIKKENFLIKVFFSPKAGCLENILNCIDNSKNEIIIFSYGFSCPKIFGSIIKAKNRGVSIYCLFDRSNLKQKKNLGRQMKNLSKTFRVNNKAAIQHNKIIIIDEKIVITGSYNFTYSAQERNLENICIIEDEKTALIYKKKFIELINDSELTREVQQEDFSKTEKKEIDKNKIDKNFKLYFEKNKKYDYRKNNF